MPLIKRVKDVWLFDNGILAVCDINGEQIGELQGAYSIDLHKRILLEALPDCEFKGLEKLPPGFRETVYRWYNHFKTQNLSWDEINSQL